MADWYHHYDRPETLATNEVFVSLGPMLPSLSSIFIIVIVEFHVGILTSLV